MFNREWTVYTAVSRSWRFMKFDLFQSYIISEGVCYLCICDRSYPRKLAFTYLEELAKEFNLSYGSEISKPNLRPYAFVKFGASSGCERNSRTNSIQTRSCNVQSVSIRIPRHRAILIV